MKYARAPGQAAGKRAGAAAGARTGRGATGARARGKRGRVATVHSSEQRAGGERRAAASGPPPPPSEAEFSALAVQVDGRKKLPKRKLTRPPHGEGGGTGALALLIGSV